MDHQKTIAVTRSFPFDGKRNSRLSHLIVEFLNTLALLTIILVFCNVKIRTFPQPSFKVEHSFEISFTCLPLLLFCASIILFFLLSG